MGDDANLIIALKIRMHTVGLFKVYSILPCIKSFICINYGICYQEAYCKFLALYAEPLLLMVSFTNHVPDPPAYYIKSDIGYLTRSGLCVCVCVHACVCTCV